jgi:hypothetical protein
MDKRSTARGHYVMNKALPLHKHAPHLYAQTTGASNFHKVSRPARALLYQACRVRAQPTAFGRARPFIWAVE